MKTIEKWQKQYETLDKTKAGYSDVRLWPCYVTFSGLILLLAPAMGILWAITIVTIPAIYIAVKAAKIQNSNPMKAAAEWQAIRDMYAAIELRDELAAIESKKLAKEVQQKDTSFEYLETSAPIATAVLNS